MRYLLTLLAALWLPSLMVAQQGANFWQSVALDAVQLPDDVERQFEPYDYYTFKLDYQGLAACLKRAPMEFTAEAEAGKLLVKFPVAESGRLETFAVVESPVMMPGLAARYSEIRTYHAESVETPGKRMRFTLSPYWGFQAFTRRPDKGSEYLEPVARGQNTYYMVYDRLNFPRELRTNVPTAPFTPSDLPALDPSQNEPGTSAVLERGGAARPVLLKIFRFACTTTGEFGQDHGGTKEKALAAVVDYTNKLNVIYETDLAIRLKLVDDEDKLIHVDPNTDPFTGSTVFEWMSQNPVAIVQGIGTSDKYDLGHVFARYMGVGGAIGVAGGIACTGSKGFGCSSAFPPYGDYFLSIAGQEIGHQWAAGHTFSSCGADAQYNAGEACEPGSGSTIMSYAGACGSANNVQNQADLYYHGCSIKKIQAFIQTTGSTCGINQPTGNNYPEVAIPYKNNFFIPISTPFELVGTASDPDGDPLTYAWDEIDTGPLETPLGQAEANSPLFRSVKPSSSPARSFPRIQTLITNTKEKTEVLPTYSRSLNFAFIARDNRPGGGGITFDTLAFKVSDAAGPFTVSYPNTANDDWEAGAFYSVTWNVANTDKSPVNSKRMNIRMSTDGGFTYPVILASNVANLGYACVQAPNVITDKARIRVEAADNVFFDISNANFSIQAPATPGFGFCPASQLVLGCVPYKYELAINTGGWAGYNTPIEFSVKDLPAGVVPVFSSNSVVPGTPVTLTLNFPLDFPENTYSFVVEGKSGNQVYNETINFTTTRNNFDAMALNQPADGAVGVNLSPLLKWTGSVDANTYQVEVSESPNFNALVASAEVKADSFKMPVFLGAGKIYYWRVRPVNECGAGDWLVPAAFSTAIQVCDSYAASDLPKSLSGAGTPTVESVITINKPGSVNRVNLKRISGSHAALKDLDARLVSPDGTTVQLFSSKCGTVGATFNFGINDDAPNTIPCPFPNNGFSYRGTDKLQAFAGKEGSGKWTLRVKDNNAGNGGTITGFEVELCLVSSAEPPVIIKNITLPVTPGANAAINQDFLQASHPTATVDELVFILTSLPKNGDLKYQGNPLKVGDTFTQAQINSNDLRYYNFGPDSPDNFHFVVTESKGGLVTGVFNIFMGKTGLTDVQNGLKFDITPNPASGRVRLAFGRALAGETRIDLVDLSGRRLKQWTVQGNLLSQELDIQGLPAGIYLISVGSENLAGVQKLVIK